MPPRLSRSFSRDVTKRTRSLFHVSLTILFQMEIAEFVEVKRPRWSALERLLDKAETDGLKALTLDEARALSRLYRGTSSDLLWVRARAGSADINGFLNDLVARAYAITYPGKRARLSDVTRFLTTGFPDVMRREWRAFAAAVLVFVAGYGFGWIGMVFDPDAALYIVDEQHLLTWIPPSAPKMPPRKNALPFRARPPSPAFCSPTTSASPS